MMIASGTNSVLMPVLAARSSSVWGMLYRSAEASLPSGAVSPAVAAGTSSPTPARRRRPR